MGAGAESSWGSTFVRLGWPPRAGVGCVLSGCSGLASRAAALRLREVVVGGGFGVGSAAGGFGELRLAEAAESLAEERVTLDDMRIC